VEDLQKLGIFRCGDLNLPDFGDGVCRFDRSRISILRKREIFTLCPNYTQKEKPASAIAQLRVQMVGRELMLQEARLSRFSRVGAL